MLAIIKQKSGGGMTSVQTAQRLLDTADDNFENYHVLDHGQGKVDLENALSPQM